MKKFLILSFICLIIAITAFFAGWLQFKVGPNEYGVVYSKLSGYKKNIIVPGKFYWNFDSLIPKNTSIITLSARPQTYTATYTQELPSGLAYKKTLVGDIDFTYTYNFSFSYVLKQEAVIDLVKNQGINSDNMDSWYNRKTEILSFVASQEISKALTDYAAEYDLYDLMLPDSPLEKTVKGNLEKYFNDITITDFRIYTLKIPDKDLYNRAKNLYLELLEAKNESLKNEITLSSGERIQNDLRLDMLKGYGELISQYPGLIEVLQQEQSMLGLP